MTGYVTTPILEAVDLGLGYRNRTVSEHLDIAIEKGTVTALVGPNGSGKSTLLMGPWPGSWLLGTDRYGWTAPLFVIGRRSRQPDDSRSCPRPQSHRRGCVSESSSNRVDTRGSVPCRCSDGTTTRPCTQRCPRPESSTSPTELSIRSPAGSVNVLG